MKHWKPFIILTLLAFCVYQTQAYYKPDKKVLIDKTLDW